MSFEERLGLLVDEQCTLRDETRLKTRLRTAALRQTACLEDIDFRHPRGLDKSLVKKLATGAWLREHMNCLITGPTGVGKSYLACALAHQACRDGYSVRYLRLQRWLAELTIAKGDGRYRQQLAQLARLDLPAGLRLLCSGPIGYSRSRWSPSRAQAPEDQCTPWRNRGGPCARTANSGLPSRC